MSKMKNCFSSKILFLGICLLCSAGVSAQDLEVFCRIENSARPKIHISGKILKTEAVRPTRNWALETLPAAGTENSGKRVSGLELRDDTGRVVGTKKLMEGEYLAESEAREWVYELDLTPSADFTAKAHFSWLAGDQGILFAGDLLPILHRQNSEPVSARIKFLIPADWQIISSEADTGGNTFQIKDIKKSVFAVGKNWREKKSADREIRDGAGLFWRVAFFH